MQVQIVGMGALGVMYANHMMEQGVNISFVMDSARVEKYQGQEILCNGKKVQFPIVDFEKAEPADLLLVAVKYTALKQTIEQMKKSVGAHTIIVSVMNGISTEDMIAEVYGEEKLIYTVAQGMDAMKLGNEMKYTQMGQLCIGAKLPIQEKNVEKVEDFFNRIHMPYIHDKNIMHRIWGKFMLNVGVNQVCMAYGATYRQALADTEENRVMLAAMNEVIAIANAEGIDLSQKDRAYYIELLKKLDPESFPSMAQDRVARRPSEVEMFAGTVMVLGRKHNIPTPVNDKLYEMVCEIEREYNPE